MDATFIQERITATKAQIVLYEDAITAIVTDGASSYTFDTGQNTQTVTKLNLPALQRTVESLYNRCTTLEARLNGGGTMLVGPQW